MKKALSISIVVTMLFLYFGIVVAADVVHEVKSGDTLSIIAERYRVPYQTIAEKNNIRNVNLILAGQKLIIPEDKANTYIEKTVISTAPISTRIIITDVIGRVVTLDKPADKILGTHNPTLNIGIVLGGGDKYIAGFGNKMMANKLYEHVMKDYDSIIQIGKASNINYETVVSLGKNNVAVLPERFIDQLELFENIGIKAVVALPNSESFDTIKKSLLIVGAVLGEERRADQINGYIDKSILETKALSAKARTRPRVLFLGASNRFSVASTPMIQTDIIDMAGGINAVKDLNVKGSFAVVNIEQIIAWNPDIIWIPKYASYTVEELLKDPKWGSIKAIRNKAVYMFPCDLEPWDYPTASAALGLRWGLYNLHPELYCKNDLMKDADAFYNMVYGKKFSQEQMGIK